MPANPPLPFVNMDGQEEIQQLASKWDKDQSNGELLEDIEDELLYVSILMARRVLLLDRYKVMEMQEVVAASTLGQFDKDKNSKIERSEIDGTLANMGEVQGQSLVAAFETTSLDGKVVTGMEVCVSFFDFSNFDFFLYSSPPWCASLDVLRLADYVVVVQDPPGRLLHVARCRSPLFLCLYPKRSTR